MSFELAGTNRGNTLRFSLWFCDSSSVVALASSLPRKHLDTSICLLSLVTISESSSYSVSDGAVFCVSRFFWFRMFTFSLCCSLSLRWLLEYALPESCALFVLRPFLAAMLVASLSAAMSAPVAISSPREGSLLLSPVVLFMKVLRFMIRVSSSRKPISDRLNT